MNHSHSIKLAGITPAKVAEASAIATRKARALAAHEGIEKPMLKESWFAKKGAELIGVGHWREAIGKGTHFVCVVEVVVNA